MAYSGIVKLDPATVGKIAAGEVVERPASVVKELVENSIDAGADQITVEVQQAPEKYIRITDNGSGISREDAPLVFEGHATSKIRSMQDLESVSTLGFRGEALASIAAVSRVELTSSTGQEGGVRIVAEGGEVKSIEEMGCAKGTTIKVADLFFNTPARLKFLKTKNTETNRIIDILTRYALGASRVHFRLVCYGKEVLNSPATADPRENMAHIYGIEVGRKMLEIGSSAAGISISGLVSPPEINKGTSQDITFFANGRYVQSPALVQALMDGYRTQLMKHRYPVGVVTLELDPRAMDVNIHPAKTEVRFRNEKGVCQVLREAVAAVLGTLEQGPEMSLEEKDFPGDAGARSGDLPLFGSDALVEPASAAGKMPAEKGETFQTRLGGNEVEMGYVDAPGEEGSQVPRMRPLGQVHNTYIVAETEDGMLVIDQHAAAERVNLERILHSMETGHPMKQELISPVELELGPKEVNMLIDHREVLEAVGFEVEEFGRDTILVRSLPVVLGRLADSGLVREVLEEITALGSPKAMEEFRDSVAHIVACKGAIKAGDPLTRGQIEDLVRGLYSARKPYSCAHGRPTILSLTRTELEKRFKRIV